VLGDGNKKLSKRDPSSSLFHLRDRGFIREGLVNYLSLLGWSIGDDRDVFSIDELIAAFDVTKVSANPARFDLKKAEAINGTHIRELDVEDFVTRVIPYLATGGVLPESPSDEQLAKLRVIAPLVQERIIVLSDSVDMLRFLFIDEETFAPEEDAATKVLNPDAEPVLRAAIGALEALPAWETAAIEQALKDALVEGLGLKPRKAFAPVRVAITGRTVSPPLYESMELLGREVSLGRLNRALPK
jgi:glutamyl-tRNA synthetase